MMSDDVNNASFVPSYIKKFVSEDDLAVENDNPPPSKRSKAQTAGKAIAEVGIKVTGKVGKKTKANKYDEEIVPASNEEQPQEPKLKKVKVKVHNEINIMAKKIKDKTQEMQSEYGDIVKSMSTMQAEDGSNRKPASKTPSQAQEMGGRRLKREGMIADINALYDLDVTPDLSTNHSDLMEVDKRYILLTIYSCLDC